MPSCQNKSASALWDIFPCNTSISENVCSYFYADRQDVLTISNYELWCEQIIDGENQTSVLDGVTYSDWCLALYSSRDGMLSQGYYSLIDNYLIFHTLFKYKKFIKIQFYFFEYTFCDREIKL